MGRYFPKTVQTSGLDYFSLLKKRRSIRSYRPDQVSKTQIETILAAGEHSPSGGNRHPWKHSIVSDERMKRLIREKCEKADEAWHKAADEKMKKWLKTKHITSEKPFLTEAPVLIVVFADSEDPYWRESVWISIGFMVLAAVDQGLGSVIYTPGDPSFLNEVLDVSKRYVPQAILPVGYPIVEPQYNPTKQTDMEYNIGSAQKVSESKPEPDRSDFDTQQKTKQETDKQAGRKCACGCGRKIISLNAKRMYIHGHAKFGHNGLLDVLKNPPRCKCGCGEPTEWDWEKMTWKKYVDKHIGIQKSARKIHLFVREQIDLFK